MNLMIIIKMKHPNTIMLEKYEISKYQICVSIVLYTISVRLWITYNEGCIYLHDENGKAHYMTYLG